MKTHGNKLNFFPFFLFDDRLPRILEGKYLKTIFKCHECAGTLDGGDLDGDGEVRIWELDWVVKGNPL